MDLALWIAAGVLAVVALVGGLAKAFVPMEKLAAAPGGAWVGDAAPWFVRTLGFLEILAAVGLVVPALVDVAPAMVVVTAVCWVLLMIGAMITHGRRGETAGVAVNIVYLALAVFVIWGRVGAGPESFLV
jgi:hypothetical protein